MVRISEMTCTCGKWQIFHYPCSHLYAACKYANVDIWQYVDQFYSIDAYVGAYGHHFQPFEHEDYWTVPDMPRWLPNIQRRRKKGRPQSSRLRNEMDWRENIQKPRCGICRIEGHDRRTCPNK